MHPDVAGMDVNRFETIMVRLEHNLEPQPEDRDFLGLMIMRIETMRSKLPQPHFQALEAAKRRLALTDREF